MRESEKIVVMPKHKKKRKHRDHDRPGYTQAYKRRIEDKNLTTFTQISMVEHYPRYESICSEQIRPSNGTNLNELGSFLFEIKTGKNDIVMIQPSNQLTIEGRTYVNIKKTKTDSVTSELIVDANKADIAPDRLLHAQTKYVGAAANLDKTTPNNNLGWSPWKWPIGTGAGVLFNDIERSYNGKVRDESSSWPYRGQCLNQEACIALYLGGNSDKIEYEKTFGHFIPFNDVSSQQGSEYELATRKLYHEDQNDYKAVGKKNFSRRFYVTIPGYPFRSLTDWFAKNGEFNDHMTVIPPMTHVKIILRKNMENALMDLGDNVEVITTADNVYSTSRVPTANDLTADVDFQYDDIYITVRRAIPEAKFNLYHNNQFTTPYTYSRFNTYDLPTGSFIFSPEIAWTTTRIPSVGFLYFVRDFDIVNVPNKHLTLSSNRFFFTERLEIDNNSTKVNARVKSVKLFRN